MLTPQQAFDSARATSTQIVGADPTARGAAKAWLRLRVIADSDWPKVVASAEKAGHTVDCRKGCDYCCHEPMPISFMEAVAISQRLASEWSPDEREALAQRASEYRALRLAGRPAPCPFLVDRACSIHEFRPLACRGVHSIDVEVCKARLQGAQQTRPGAVAYTEECFALMDGLSMGVPGRTYPDQFELGVWAEQMARGCGPEDSVLESMTPALHAKAKEEPAGFYPTLPPQLQHFAKLRDELRMEDAFKVLVGLSPTVQRLMRFWVPLVYESQEQLNEWHERADAGLDALIAEDTDPAAAFNALSQHSTYAMGYMGMDLTERLTRFGTWVHERVVAPLFPDLVAPIEGPRKPGKLRVGYASPEVANKNGTRWALRWLQGQRGEFETYVFSLGHLQDAASEAFMLWADHYYRLPVDVPSAARFIRDLDLDVLIFPEVGQNGRAVQFAAMRLARVQCTAWGYPTTSGLPTVHCYIAGEGMLAPNSDIEFSERLVRLPGSGVDIPPSVPVPGSDNLPPLPPEYLLVAQNIFKLTPRWDFLYREIAERTGRPVVMVEHYLPAVNAMIERRLQGANIHWLPFLNANQFERVLAGAAASLDTPDWSGGVTGHMAAQIGVPVVTLPREWMRTRMSKAFMEEVGMNGGVAASPEEFIRVASDRELLASMRLRHEKSATRAEMQKSLNEAVLHLASGN